MPASRPDALRLGLVNRVVPAEQLDSAAAALIERLAKGPTLAYGAMKRLMRAGIEAFFARQPAHFKGR